MKWPPIDNRYKHSFRCLITTIVHAQATREEASLKRTVGMVALLMHVFHCLQGTTNESIGNSDFGEDYSGSYGSQHLERMSDDSDVSSSGGGMESTTTF